MDSIFGSAPQWSLVFEESRQDFRYGAKTGSVIHASALPSKDDFDIPEWMEDDLQPTDLEAFADVLLPTEDTSIKNYETVSPSNFSFITTREEEPSNLSNSLKEKPKIKIKIKKVKRTRNDHFLKPVVYTRSISSQEHHEQPNSSSLFSHHREETHAASPPTAEILYHTLQSPQKSDFDELKEDCNLLPEDLSGMKLSDIMDCDDADQILNEFLALEPSEISSSLGCSPVFPISESDYNVNSELYLSPWSSPNGPNLSPSSSSSSSIGECSILGGNETDSIFPSSVSPWPNPDPIPHSPVSPWPSPDPTSLSFDKIEESNNIDVLDKNANIRTRRKRTNKPRRSISPESRYNRKKEQNKQAALRYRMKKREEDDVLLQTLKEEEERNKELKETYANLKNELTFMKKLMREVFKLKGNGSAEACIKKLTK